MDGRAVEFTFRRPSKDVLVEKQTETKSGKETELKRQFSKEGMAVEMHVGDVVATSYFARAFGDREETKA